MHSPTTIHRSRSLDMITLSSSGPATQALERSIKRRRVSIEQSKEDVEASSTSIASSVCSTDDYLSLDDLFSSLTETNKEEAFPTISWAFDDE